MHQFITRGGSADEFTVDIADAAYQTVSVTIVRSVAAYTGNEPDELPRLAPKVDPEGLDKLTEITLQDSTVVNTEVSFHYYGFEITVSSVGKIRFRRIDDTAESA